MRASCGLAPLVGLAAFALLAATPTPARAEESIDVGVSVVYASKKPGVVEASCREIQKRLPMDFGALHMLQSERFRLSFGEPAQFALPTGRSVRILPISVVNGRLHLHFELSGIVSTHLQLVSGMPVIVGGEPHEDGQLIIELRPTFRVLGAPERPPRNARALAPSAPEVQKVRVRGEK